MTERSSGILMHISSFPNPFGKGDFGPEAFGFVDWLSQTKQSLWQILPLTFPDDAGSPYTSLSAHAIYAGYISPLLLKEKGYISDKQWQEIVSADMNIRDLSLSIAFDNWKKNSDTSDFDQFCKDHIYWLHDAALFFTLHKKYPGVWQESFPPALKDRENNAIRKWEEHAADAILKFKFEQFIAYSQWMDLKAYANRKGIRIIGDIPIFISGDSSDVWAHRALFKLDENGYPRVWTGVPPDLFTTTGQLWAQPHYDWNAVRENGFAWWVERTRIAKIHADIIRIDHFRGFCAAYEVEYGAPTAEVGEWVEGPRSEIFKVLHERIPDLCIIAEDLGIITADVTALRKEFGYPGMKILLFAFNGDHNNDYLPHNYDPDDRFVVYTGTHDNNTVRGWFNSASDHEKQMLAHYCDPDPETVAWSLIGMAYRSNAMWAVVPLQDILGLDESARMNLPGTVVNNWNWQLEKFEPTEEVSEKLRELTVNTERNPETT